MNDFRELYYTTNASVQHTEEEFKLTMSSQGLSRSFAMHPRHAKRLMNVLTQHVKEYERKFGELKTRMPLPALPDLTPSKFGFRIPLETDLRLTRYSQKTNQKNQRTSSTPRSSKKSK